MSQKVFGTRPSRRAAIAAQSHNLRQDFRIFSNLVLNDSSYRAKEVGIKIDKCQKFSSKYIAARLLGMSQVFALNCLMPIYSRQKDFV